MGNKKFDIGKNSVRLIDIPAEIVRKSHALRLIFYSALVH